MARVGIVGLGNMGMGMACNLMTKGHTVQGHARRCEVTERFGGIDAADVAGVAEGAQAVFFMVTPSPSRRRSTMTTEPSSPH